MMHELLKEMIVREKRFAFTIIELLTDFSRHFTADPEVCAQYRQKCRSAVSACHD